MKRLIAILLLAAPPAFAQTPPAPAQQPPAPTLDQALAAELGACNTTVQARNVSTSYLQAELTAAHKKVEELTKELAEAKKLPEVDASGKPKQPPLPLKKP